ncbi:MAG TPA: molybdopterin-dependent oxidoreductase [Longimicrobiales bacterium]
MPISTPKRTHPYDDQHLNAGSRPTVAADTLITPTADFFTRSHATPPAIDARAWRLEVGGLVDRPTHYSLAELGARFERHEVTATLVCAGMRRAELLALGPLPGELPWEADAAGTGVWTGFRLGDVLRAAGARPEAAHVEFIGLDRVERHGHEFGFGGSIDLAKALSDEVILATHLNGAPLPREHGFPMRVLVPGWIGARQIKWLGRLNVTAAPSDNYFQTMAYRVQREVNPDDPRDVTSGVAMTEVPVNAVIIAPGPRDVLKAGTTAVRGWAMGTGCAPVRTIEVSVDDGEWIAAHAIADAGAWGWLFWEAVVELAVGMRIVRVRARDGTTAMPATIDETWNVKGYGNNAWHQVRVEVV